MKIEYRENWRNDWLSSIAELANIEEQWKLWVDPLQTNPHYSFVEYVNSYFDAFGGGENEYGWVVESGYVSQEEADCISVLHTLLKNYVPPMKDSYDHLAILNDPGSLDIVKAAEASCLCLRQLIDDKEAKLLKDQLGSHDGNSADM